jgi:phosphohistidine phosphatase
MKPGASLRAHFMILYIVRHAWAVERDEWKGPDDEPRPLTAEGRKRFAKVVKRLAGRDFAPDVVATSPLVRTRETADIIAQRLDKTPEIVELPALAPNSDLDALLAWTAEQAADEIAWVGHAPDVELLFSALISDGSTAVRFPKGAVAAIRFTEKPARQQGRLQWFVTAKILGV